LYAFILGVVGIDVMINEGGMKVQLLGYNLVNQCQ